MGRERKSPAASDGLTFGLRYRLESAGYPTSPQCICGFAPGLECTVVICIPLISLPNPAAIREYPVWSDRRPFRALAQGFGGRGGRVRARRRLQHYERAAFLAAPAVDDRRRQLRVRTRAVGGGWHGSVCQ